MLSRQYATTFKLADAHILSLAISLYVKQSKIYIYIYFRIVDKTSICDLSRHITLIPVFFKALRK